MTARDGEVVLKWFWGGGALRGTGSALRGTSGALRGTGRCSVRYRAALCEVPVALCEVRAARGDVRAALGDVRSAGCDEGAVLCEGSALVCGRLFARTGSAGWLRVGEAGKRLGCGVAVRAWGGLRGSRGGCEAPRVALRVGGVAVRGVG